MSVQRFLEKIAPEAGPADLEAEIDRESCALIGVCGVQASGKTVFLTCIYQTLESVIPEQGGLSFDRKEIGGAAHFEEVEATIRREGKTVGTSPEGALARFFIKVDDPASRHLGHLPVYLFDFAGMYFETYADHTILKSEEITDELRERHRQIAHFIDRCDGLIILISATHFSADRAATYNPFPNSVKNLIQDCREKKRPLALVVTQPQNNPSFDFAKLMESERIQRFRKHFTGDLRAALNGGDRPFGLVTHLNCYEVDARGRVVQQSADGTIWRPEAARVFLAVLRAAWPAVKARMEAADKKKRDDERAHRRRVYQETQERLRKQERRGRRRRLVSWMAAALVVALVAAAGVGAYFLRERMRLDDARFVDATAAKLENRDLDEISPEDIARLPGIREPFADRPDKVTPEMRQAFTRFWNSLRGTAEDVLTRPSLDADYEQSLRRLAGFEPSLAGNETSWWNDQVKPLLHARLAYFDARSQTPADPARPAQLTDEHRKRIEALGDQAFADLLTAAAREEKRAWVAKWEAEIDIGSTVDARLEALNARLAESDLLEDRELQVIAREFLARKLVQAILELEANRLSRPLLAALHSEVGRVSTSLRFDILYDELKSTDTLAEYQSLRNQMTQTWPRIVSAPEDRKLQTRLFLGNLFRGLDREESAQIWRAMADAAREGYLFDLAPDASVVGIKPFPIRLEQALDGGAPPSTAMRGIEAELIEEPLYGHELHAIEGLIDLRILIYDALARYKAIRQQTASMAYVRSGERLETAPIEYLLDQVPKLIPEEPYLAETREAFEAMQQQLLSVRRSLQDFNADPNSNSKDYVKDHVERLIRSLCQVTLNSRTGDCADVA